MAEARKRTSRSEGSSERPGSRDLDWKFSPRGWYLSNVVVWRGPCPGARAQHRQGRIAASAAGPDAPRSEEKDALKGRPAPEDQTNHIPVRRTAAVAPKGDA